MKQFLCVAFILMMWLAIGGCAATNTGKSSTGTNDRWFAEKTWLNGLSRTPHESIDRQEFSKQYHQNKELWDKAFAYLKQTDLVNLKAGRYAIDGENVFALVTEGPTRELDKTRWEAHKNYNDIHFVIIGKETMGLTPVAGAVIAQEYDASRDIAFYTSEGKYYTSDTGNFFIAFTKDAHRPGIKAEGADTVKKVVIKIRNS